MKMIKYRPVRLCLAVVALLVSALATITHPANAAPSANARQMSTTALSAPAASGTECNFVESLQTCESTDPTVAYYDTVTGNPTDCTFLFNVAWGDGASSTKTVANPPAGSHNLIGEHTYAAPGTYTITVNPQVTAGTPCTVTSSVHTFTLAPPTPTPAPTPTPPATITLVPAGTAQVNGHTVPTYLVTGKEKTHYRGKVVVAVPVAEKACVIAIVEAITAHGVAELIFGPYVIIAIAVIDGGDIFLHCVPVQVKSHLKQVQVVKLHKKS